MRECERREERQVCGPKGGNTATMCPAEARERRWRPFDSDSGQAFFNIPIDCFHRHLKMIG